MLIQFMGYGYGYSIAQDRLFQMDMARRSTQGLVSEVLGADYLEFDKNARQIFLPASIRKQMDLLDAKDRDVFEGYATSLNAWLAEIESKPENINGPQFGWFAPAYTYSVGLHGAGIDVVGNTPFGYPMVMFGHNDSITWGSTWAAGDIVDIFAEQLNPENPNQYWYKGAFSDMESRVEVIDVLGQESETVTLYRSTHGPIIHRDQDGAGKQSTAYAKQRAWDGKELETLLAWLYATWAKDYDGWVAEAEKSAINVNMYFADVDGNIGYFFGGQYPQRAAGHDNRLPAKGDGSMDWQGRLSPSLANPHVLNPTGGYLVNWNNKSGQGVMDPDEFWYSWSEADRVDYLQDAIEGREKFTADQAWGLIEDSSYADLHLTYLSELIDQVADSSPELKEANQILQQWDGKKNFLGVPQDFDQQPLIAQIEQNRGTENNMIIMKPGVIVGYEVVPPGQNAFISPNGERAINFEDQFELYSNFEKKRTWFYPSDVEAHKVSETRLTLPGQ